MIDRRNYHLDRAYNLAAQIQSILRETALSEAELRLDTWPADEVIKSSTVFDQDVGALSRLVKALDQELKVAEFQPEAPNSRTDRWTALRVRYVKVTLPLRPIHRGYIKPTIIFPRSMPVSDLIAAFITKIPGYDQFLHGDNHGYLWHYHYMNSKKDHSDTVLCWDTRATLTRESKRPIFQEKHGEGGNVFAARPDLWGNDKRQTIHEAAYPDLGRWPLNEFRCASNKSQPVWPLGAKLTPVPTKAPVPPKHPTKSKKQKRR